MVLNLFHGLTYQNYPFQINCLVLLPSFFAFDSLKHILRFKFCLFCFWVAIFSKKLYEVFCLYEVFDYLEMFYFFWSKCLQIFPQGLSNSVFPDKSNAVHNIILRIFRRSTPILPQITSYTFVYLFRILGYYQNGLPSDNGATFDKYFGLGFTSTVKTGN